MSLAEYRKKRAFAKTPEPAPSKAGRTRGQFPIFVVQKHDASRLHYDFRLEVGGVLVSFAVPKGPSMDPKDKHLAMKVEDHPLAYGSFEGEIPEGQYGAGDVIVWDTGVYTTPGALTREDVERTAKRGLHAGELKIVLLGKKLNGGFALVKMRGRGGAARTNENAWLLIKERDSYASRKDVTKNVRSALSRRLLPRDLHPMKALKKRR